MKLRMIAEGSFGLDQAYRDKFVLDQSTKNMQWAVLKKLRQMLTDMGLSIQKTESAPSEPIYLAVAPFARLRDAVKSKLQRDMIKSQDGLNSPEMNEVAEFWGYDLPTDFLDTQNTHIGRSKKGTFDYYINQAKELARDLPIEGKLEVLEHMIELVESS